MLFRRKFMFHIRSIRVKIAIQRLLRPLHSTRLLETCRQSTVTLYEICTHKSKPNCNKHKGRMRNRNKLSMRYVSSNQSCRSCTYSTLTAMVVQLECRGPGISSNSASMVGVGFGLLRWPDLSHIFSYHQ